MPAEISAAMGRRPFLAATATILGSWAVPQSFAALLAADSRRVRTRLEAIKDETTGLPLVQLPEGFRYLSYGWTGDPLVDGTPTPGAHDGMAVIAEQDGVLTLCRNHELSSTGKPFGPREIVYDPRAAGGCTNLRFDTKAGKWLKAWSSLVGTIKNCAGGPTPWGSWLSCEEIVVQGGDVEKEKKLELDQAHGFIFEVPAEGTTKPVPLKAMGRFVHEAVAVDPKTGIVYETEDRTPSGFYRFVPEKPGDLAAGGRLEMLRVADQSDLIKGARLGHDYEVTWVPIAQPELAHTPGTRDGGGVFMQGQKQGGAAFARLEGCWWGNGVCYFDATSGGRAKAGQIWQYDPRSAKLRLIFESPGAKVLDSPDNLAVSPRGGLVLCEDGSRNPQRLHSLTPDGMLSELARNNVVLKGEKNGISGDFRGMEWAGATFSPDGHWLFVNLQTPGITLAITGPWEAVGL